MLYNIIVMHNHNIHYTRRLNPVMIIFHHFPHLCLHQKKQRRRLSLVRKRYICLHTQCVCIHTQRMRMELHCMHTCMDLPLYSTQYYDFATCTCNQVETTASGSSPAQSVTLSPRGSLSSSMVYSPPHTELQSIELLVLMFITLCIKHFIILSGYPSSYLSRAATSVPKVSQHSSKGC